MNSGAALWRSVRPWVFPLGLLGGYEAYARRAAALGSEALAPPSAALQAFAGAAMDGSLWQATGFTLGTAALGLLIGAGLGTLLGSALGLSQRAAGVGFLTIEVLRPVPSVALIPLAMLMFGFGVRMELAIVAFATFWPLLLLVQAAVRQVEPRLLEVSRALGLSPCERVLKIVLPAIAPRLFVALRLGVAVALVVAVTVEIAANPNGMGYAMMLAQQSFDPALMLAWLGWIGVVGVAVNALMLRLQRAVSRRMGALP
ncbi:ABC-type nitrate/sulfonate/bicarbonate transport system, permease component [Variovorax sp. HW608]|uniref:ABC transporter permease n=1 Tax=Variovorax sp. HW608 TaxID=1034889 RepID=UPI00081FB7DF|nr:ABC transporter permease subunit [Variovorax sp. HW608]SCK22823.1 ABC-type nitrate/sulfonate/bicarbonate transport system, permease component [Variovorax sp. HW608]